MHPVDTYTLIGAVGVLVLLLRNMQLHHRNDVLSACLAQTATTHATLRRSVRDALHVVRDALPPDDPAPGDPALRVAFPRCFAPRHQPRSPSPVPVHTRTCRNSTPIENDTATDRKTCLTVKLPLMLRQLQAVSTICPSSR